jgi:hypothetical protein
MNDTELNRIIEETFQNIVRNEGPSIFQTFSNFVQDLSNVILPTTTIEPTQSMDVSFNTQAQTQAETRIRQNNELVDDFSMRWFQQLNNYHNCMRDYHKNMIQMNRITNNLLINIASENNPSSSYTFLQQPRNTIEIQGFSIPLPLLPTQSQTQQQQIYPTISQVIAATSIFTYNEDHIADGMENRCPISLEDFVVGDELCEIRSCHHVFKWTNLQSWFSRNSHCPVCRFDIRGNGI